MRHKRNHPARPDGSVRAKKHLGQHFLNDRDIARKIAETLGFEGYRQVLEIGPGMGVMTRFLLEKDIDLVAMDLDTESIVYLREHFVGITSPKDQKGRLTLVEADFLKADLTDYMADGPFAITGNYPYNISTQIVFKAIDYRDRIPEFTGMFQKEVAERICAPAGNKTYGILSVWAQAFYEAEYLFTVPPEVFDPPPKVHSGVIRLTRRKKPTLDCDEALFLRIVKTAFNQRRKTLRNSLKPMGIPENRKEDTIFGLRPEQLTVADFEQLTQIFADDTV